MNYWDIHCGIKMLLFQVMGIPFFGVFNRNQLGRFDELEWSGYWSHRVGGVCSFVSDFPRKIISFDNVKVLRGGSEGKTEGKRKAVPQVNYRNRNKSKDLCCLRGKLLAL